ncbi:DUF6223 family protein [Nonomuraea pusilla]|uniref:Uncharacterized protein n=1 Tax=Nonomuraea pusilla TaxID=46177 RepID=A0A1H7HYC3_9ACTN|nr:DUF6223 family protein [Nonomuraea pusilla]SEK55353.1 hypothetical protein SAMN05660976_00630 [Nonomuraea pusilla]
MSVRHLFAALSGDPGLAPPAAARFLAHAGPVSAYTFTAGRFWSAVAALLALAGVVVGGLALARSRRRAAGGRRGAVAALAAGLVGTVIGGLVVAAAEGGPGTGYGIVGGVVALAVGLVALLLGGLALARSRRAVS